MKEDRPRAKRLDFFLTSRLRRVFFSNYKGNIFTENDFQQNIGQWSNASIKAVFTTNLFSHPLSVGLHSV